MRQYEIMFIVKPTLSEEEVKKVVTNFSDIIINNGGKVLETKDMGQRELAYEIKKFKSGFYYIFEVETDNDKAIKEFDRKALIDEKILRHLIVKEDE